MGDRVIAMWLTKDFKPHIVIEKKGDHNWAINLDALKAGKTYNFDIRVDNT